MPGECDKNVTERKIFDAFAYLILNLNILDVLLTAGYNDRRL